MEDYCCNCSSGRCDVLVRLFVINLIEYSKGNVTFIDVDGEHCSIRRSNDANDQLEWISKLLECEQSDLLSALTSRVVAARNEVFQTRQNTTRAYYGRDALSKVID